MISRYVTTILCEMNMKGTIVLYGLFTDLIIFFNQAIKKRVINFVIRYQLLLRSE